MPTVKEKQVENASTALQPGDVGTAAAKNTSDFVESGTNKARGTVYQTAGDFTYNGTPGNWYDWAGTFAAGGLQDFTHSGGVLTYTGTATRVFEVNWGGVFRGGGNGMPAWVRIGASVNDAGPDIENQRFLNCGGGKRDASGSFIVTLASGDNVRLKTEAPAGATGPASTVVYWDMICTMTVSE